MQAFNLVRVSKSTKSKAKKTEGVLGGTWADESMLRETLLASAILIII